MAEEQKKILIVEDEEPLLEALTIKFEKVGFSVLKAKDGEEALQAVKNGGPDFIILDLVIPKMNGIEVLQQMRAEPQYKDVPVLILTNYNLQGYRDAVKGLSVVDFLVKSDTEIKNVVQRVKDYLSK